jgi:hypothetical protein
MTRLYEVENFLCLLPEALKQAQTRQLVPNDFAACVPSRRACTPSMGNQFVGQSLEVIAPLFLYNVDTYDPQSSGLQESSDQLPAGTERGT